MKKGFYILPILFSFTLADGLAFRAAQGAEGQDVVAQTYCAPHSGAPRDPKSPISKIPADVAGYSQKICDQILRILAEKRPDFAGLVAEDLRLDWLEAGPNQLRLRLLHHHAGQSKTSADLGLQVVDRRGIPDQSLAHFAQALLESLWLR